MSQYDRGTADEPLLVRSINVQHATSRVGSEPGRLQMVAMDVRTSRLDQAHMSDARLVEHHFAIDSATARRLADLLLRAADDELPPT